MAKNLIILRLILVTNFILCQAAHDHHGLEIRRVDIASSADSFNNQPRFILEIDLGTCSCQNQGTDCKVAIAKSTVLEITCAQDELYCCTWSSRKTNDPADESESQPQPNEGRSLSNNPAAIISTFHDQLNFDSVAKDYEKNAQDKDGAEEQENKATIRIVPVLQTPLNNDHDDEASFPQVANKKCRCKPRGECPDEYIDLRFGFYQCSHNTTRCCEPEVMTEAKGNDKNSQPDPILNEGDNYEGEEEEEGGEEEEEKTACFCLPRSNCSETEGWQRQDDPCPGGLVQCCRNTDHENFGPQPIPLPELKIPVTEDLGIMGEDEGEGVLAAPGPAPAPPPPLPTYYNYQSPTQYSGYYYPPQGRPQQQQQQQWENNDQFRFVSRPRLPFEGQSRTIPGDSLFDKISKILG